MPNQLLLAWLNDAFAMEEALIPILQNHAKDARDHPQMQAGIENHIEETRRHAELVKACMEELGEKPSSGKSVIGQLIGNMMAPSTGPFKDELIKNAISDFATEHFEIACYSALLAAANEVGNGQLALACEQILDDERAMARLIEDHLPKGVQEILRTAEVSQ
jgi:ferritin-like metal-binding protein YciE